MKAIGNTPLIKLERLAEPGSADIYLKYEGANPTGSMKQITLFLFLLLLIASCTMNTDKKEQITNLPVIDSLWNYDNPPATAVKFRELVPQAKESGNESYYAELLTQLARTQSLQRNFNEAHAILDTVEQLISGKDWIVPRIRYLLERGRTYNSAGEKEKATVLFKAAYDKSLAHQEDFYAIDAAHMMGIAGKPSEQLQWNLKAIEMIERTTDARSKKWLGSLYNNAGWSYHESKDFNKALEFFEKSLAWREEQKDTQGISIGKWSVGRALRSLNRVDEALKIQKELFAEMEAKKSPDGYVYEEMGECLLAQGKKDEAKQHFKRAYEILSKDEWLVANEPNRPERLKELGK